MAVRPDDIVAAIRALGVRGGDRMIVHSSYRSFGRERVEGGPRAVAEALVVAVSPGGTVFVPAFNYGNDVFDRATSPSYDGIVTEFFRKRPGAVRSLHPTHSLAGVGPEAAAILEGHDRVQPFGAGSPVWRLWERNAWVLLVGVGHFADSVAHVAEELLGMPYLDRRRVARVRGSDGSIEEVVLRRPGCSDSWDAVLGPPLEQRGAVAHARVGESQLQLMRARDVVEVTADLLRRDPRSLLCNRAECDACTQASQMINAKAKG